MTRALRLLSTSALFACVLITSAQADTMTLEELGAMEPARTCYTLHPDLSRVGLEPFSGALDPTAFAMARGSEYTVTDVGDISFIAGPWRHSSLTGDHLYDSLNAFLAAHHDDYDFATLFVTEHLNFGALYSPLQNTTGGIGMPQFDQTTSTGFSELEGFLFMNSIFDYTGSIHDALFFGQELGHRWASYVRRRGGGQDMLGRDDAHWSFWMDTDNSTMEGNNWVEHTTGRWRTDFGVDVGYSQLDRYLMGFLAPEDVDDWLLIKQPQVMDNPYQWGEGNIQPSTTPYYVIQQWVDDGDDYPIVVAGNEELISIEDVTWIEGERNPSHEDSQRDFRMAFIIMHPEDEPVDFEDYLDIEDTREELSELWEDMIEQAANLDSSLGTSRNYT
ncbi:MAG TPA: hypothetical protein DIU15_06920, partial [Deltaproteobacteria bacterium]|nr:hypothetical protein [Deltaproteobacteria bacterium]